MQKQLGHSSITITLDLYSHALPGDLPTRRKWLDPDASRDPGATLKSTEKLSG